MQRRPRRAGGPPAYPLHHHFDRRGFLLRLGAAGGLLTLGGWTMVSRADEPPMVTHPDGSVTVTIPLGGYRELIVDYDLDLRYLLMIHASDEDIGQRVLDDHEALLTLADPIVLDELDPLDEDDLAVPVIEEALLALFTKYLPDAGLADSFLISVSLEHYWNEQGEIMGDVVVPRPPGCGIVR